MSRPLESSDQRYFLIVLFFYGIIDNLGVVVLYRKQNPDELNNFRHEIVRKQNDKWDHHGIARDHHGNSSFRYVYICVFKLVRLPVIPHIVSVLYPWDLLSS